MLPENLLFHTTSRFPEYAEREVHVELIEKGGSGRKYYRLSLPGITSLILVKYGPEREENRHFCDIATFLNHVGVRVPKIFFHDTEEGLIWVEDLGAVDLWHYRHEPWERRRDLYQRTLAQAAHLHLHAHKALETLPSEVPHPSFQHEFDAPLYLWEQNYFFDQCVGRHFGITKEALYTTYRGGSRERLATIAEELATYPRVLVHRDFQSQNVMIQRDSTAVLIDFQGMRLGLAQYDLASLLYDPYVPLTPEERKTLLKDYILLVAEEGEAVPSNFEAIYDLCAMQRLMQALGAYGFLGHEKGLTSFLTHIPTALASLAEVVGRIDGTEELRTLLGDLLRQGR